MAENFSPEKKGGERLEPAIKPGEIERAAKKAKQELPSAPPSKTIKPATEPVKEETKKKKKPAKLDEKAYIKEAEEIISKYADDPHEEDEEASELQQAYLADKFGKKVDKEKD